MDRFTQLWYCARQVKQILCLHSLTESLTRQAHLSLFRGESPWEVTGSKPGRINTRGLTE